MTHETWIPVQMMKKRKKKRQQVTHTETKTGTALQILQALISEDIMNDVTY